jgi:thiamine-monophosphate kinase
MTEDSFFQWLFQRLPAGSDDLVVPPGDDCAAIRWHDDKLLLIAVDQVIGGRHYIVEGPAATAPALAGRKLLARNLSDVAAMGGTPRFCLLAAAFHQDCSEAWMKAFYDGIVDAAREFRIAMIGGDLASTAQDDVASLTILGEVPAHEVITRRGARVGDVLFATGAFGNSFASAHHLNFSPRCAEGRWLAQQRLAKAMMDVSDGLLLDLSRLCKLSNCGVCIDLEAIPRRDAATTLAQACSEGEDFELIFAVAPDNVATLQETWPFAHTPLTRLGTFDDSGLLRDQQGLPLSPSGWDHLSPPSDRK